MTPTGPLTLPPTEPPREGVVAVRERARRRIRGMGALLFLGMAAVALRGVQLAVDPDPLTLREVTTKRWTDVRTQGPRGDVLDRDGAILATSVEAPAVFVDAMVFRERTGASYADRAARLAVLLDVPVDHVLDQTGEDARYKRLAEWVHPGLGERLRREGFTRQGVILEKNYRRYYPQGRLASQVLGFVDGAGRGRQGLEAYFDDRLRGEELVSQHRVNRWGKVLELFDRDPRRLAGHQVRTTLDRVVQRATERALQDVMVRHEPLSATAVVVDVHTGEILAMASTPGFDPNASIEDFSTTRNRALADAYEPGSVFKPFTLAAALERGAVRLDERIGTPSPWRVAGVPIRDDHPHPSVTAAEMVKYSSNIGAARIAERVGPDALLASFEAFGFGEPSGIQTQGEVVGVRRPRSHFGPVELATISYGQGVQSTALQLAMATAAIANDGVRMKPRLVSEVRSAEGDVVRTFDPVVARRAVSAETAAQVRRAMEMVFEEGGTAQTLRIPGFTAGGKTGTAEKVSGGRGYGSARVSSFVGYAPAEAPRLAMAIIVDEPSRGSRYGGVVAGPAFTAVLGEALPHLGLRPDPARMPEEDAVASAPSDRDDDEDEVLDTAASPGPLEIAWLGGAWSVPDLRGRSLRDTLAGLQGTGWELQVDGSGHVVQQDPAPGRPLAPGQRLRLRLQ